MADDININIFNEIDETIKRESQSDSARSNDENEKYLQQQQQRRKKMIEEENKTASEAELQLLAEKYRLEKQNQEEINRLSLEGAKKKEELANTEQEKRDAKTYATYLEMAQSITSSAVSSLEALYNKIKDSGTQYAEYVETLEVGLIGSTKSYESVSETLSKVFATNVFFSLSEVLQRTAEAVEMGITYNVELRSALDVFSDKIAATFDAFDDTLTRLIKIQQEDSTQARLGMESLLTYYLNENFSTTEYLVNISDNVSAAILEAMAAITGDSATEEAAELEYAIQKWLGSYSSAGVSDSTILALAEGLGYLGSGDVSALASNNSLQQLLALSIAKSGSSKSYGEMLLNGIDVEDVSAIMTGFYNLVSEISNSDNLVALNQYAEIFGLTVSDVTSVLNLTSEQISVIAQDMASYSDMLQQVESELSTSNLLERTAYSEMITNIENNLLASIGMSMANSIGANLAYLAVDLSASILDMLDLKTNISPFGVGTGFDISSSSLLKSTAAVSTYLISLISNVSSIASALSPQLEALGGETSNIIKLVGGTGTNTVTSGTSSNQIVYYGASDSSTVYSTVSQLADEVSASVVTADIDEEQEKITDMVNNMSEVNDNVAFIVQLLNINGIKVRSLPGDSDTIATFTKDSTGFYSQGGY